MIALEKLKLTEPNIVENCSVALGLSLGEYSALCFAGCLTYEDGVKLTSIRGKAMQYASNIIPSGMISIVGLSQEIIEKLCYETSTDLQQDIQIGNYLTENNFTISGSIETLNYFIKLINKSNYHPNKLLFLSVSGAFHSSYMRPALPLLQTELLNTTILPSNISIISNTLGRPYQSIEEIRNELIKQVIEPVQWKKSMDYILHPDNQFEIAYEIGPGRVCTGILKNISRRAKVINILA